MKYHQILISAIWKALIGSGFIFQNDNDPKHAVNAVKTSKNMGSSKGSQYPKKGFKCPSRIPENYSKERKLRLRKINTDFQAC